MVVAHPVPSDVQPTVGSECNESPVKSGKKVCPQLVPPSPEKNWACRLFPMLFEAAIICWGSLMLIRMSDSLRGLSLASEIFKFCPTDGATAALNSGADDGCRSWWRSIHAYSVSKAIG